MKLIILQERQNSSQLEDRQRQREKEKINDLLSMREIHRVAKPCPSCKMDISRIGGCNKMVCDNCGTYFFAIAVIRQLVDMSTSGRGAMKFSGQIGCGERGLMLAALSLRCGKRGLMLAKLSVQIQARLQAQMLPNRAHQMWVETINARQVTGQIQAQNLPNCAHSCPNRRQMNAKGLAITITYSAGHARIIIVTFVERR
ncbi:hypothetical protein P3S67_029079 [Capsicum chacoense]